MNLSERLRTIIKPPAAIPNRPETLGSFSPDHQPDLPLVPPGLATPHGLVETTLGGEWRDGCFVVERCVNPGTYYGHSTIADVAARLRSAASEAALVGGAAARPPFVFFDLETTGLNGGAGTFAFLVGFGYFDEADRFVIRQYILVRFADERPLLAAVAHELTRAGALVSFNGKSFDASVLETRYLFHRLEWPGARLPHMDVLHPARRLWRDQLESSCSLIALEQQILGRRRGGDIDGYDIPARYFRFVRSGDPRPLVAVLQHNQSDLLSLATLTARLLDLIRVGPRFAHDGREALALGRVYARAGFEERAVSAFEEAVNRGGPLVAESLRALATAYRRARRFDDASRCWRRLLDVEGCPRHLVREANHALAVHHEHRVRDYVAAKIFALRTLEYATHPGWTESVRYRVARIERKLGNRLW